MLKQLEIVAKTKCLAFWVWSLLLSMAVTLPSGSALAHGVLGAPSPMSVSIEQADDLAIPVGKAISHKMENPDERVLFVFDVDNTLLRMPQRLGDDSWFNYHADRLEAGDRSSFPSFEALLEAQSILFSMSQMVTTQSDSQSLITELTDAGVDIFLLTARSPELYDTTARELDRNSISYTHPYVCAFYLCSASGRYDDSDLRRALTAIGEPTAVSAYRSILIRDGLMMVAGQDKGVMLDLLLAGIGGQRYDAVFFVDDGAHNIEAVAAHEFPVPVRAFHYTRWNGEMTDVEAIETDVSFNAIRSVVCVNLTSDLCSE